MRQIHRTRYRLSFATPVSGLAAQYLTFSQPWKNSDHQGNINVLQCE